MKKTVATALPEPKPLRIPSPLARSVEAALERLAEHLERRFDVWIHAFATVNDAIALRARLDEESWSRAVALVALVDRTGTSTPDEAMAVAAAGVAAGIKAVLPATVAPAILDRVVATALDRQRELAAYAALRKQRQVVALQEANLRAAENSLAKRLYGKLTPLTGAELTPTHPLREATAQFERLYISRVLAEAEGDAHRAMEILEVSKSAFYRYLRVHDLQHLVRKSEGDRDAGADS